MRGLHALVLARFPDGRVATLECDQCRAVFAADHSALYGKDGREGTGVAVCPDCRAKHRRFLILQDAATAAMGGNLR